MYTERLHTYTGIAARYNTVNLRIEANSSTLYEGLITSGPRNITAAQGNLLTYYCDGRTPNAPSLPPINTPTAALDQASKQRGFNYVADFFEESFYDFAISTIGTSTDYYVKETSGYFTQEWVNLVNYQETTNAFGYDWGLGGCHERLAPGDDVLWAFTPLQPDSSAIHDTPFLKLTPAAVTVKKGKGFKVTVIDGKGGSQIQGASVSGVKTDLKGTATLSFSKPGSYQFKAHKTGTVRSNMISVTVTD